MVTKTITVVEEAYKALAREKSVGESFSEVILKMTGRRGSLLDCVGTWKVSDKELDRMESELGEGWKSFGKHLKAI